MGWRSKYDTIINVKGIIETAKTYYDKRGRLIYTYRGRVFMRGDELYDPENDDRGRIDCSSYVHLALLGVPYEESPYVTGDVEGFFNTPCPWYPLAQGKDVMSIGKVFAANSERGRDIRRASGLARFCREHGLEIAPDTSGSYDEVLEPDDLVFFEAAPSRLEEYIYYKIWMAIAHVGIVAEDTRYMINATGSSKHELNAKNEAIRYTRIADKGKPVLAARIKQDGSLGSENILIET